jgi:hypothetical protein
VNLEELVAQWHAEQPHPRAPKLKVGDFPVAVRLATMLKFGQGHASPSEAENFWHEFKSMNDGLMAQKKMPVSPEEFTHLAQQAGRSSFAYHGRPPSMYELQRLRDADPRAIHDYYGGLPDEHYPTVSAADMARALHAARPWANQILDRDPVKLEGAYLHHSGQNPRDYYFQVSNGGNDQTGAQPGSTGAGDAGGQQADARAGDPGVAAGNAAAGRSKGVPQG